MITREYWYEPRNMRHVAVIRRGKHEVKLTLSDSDVAMGSRFNIHEALREIVKREQQDYFNEGLSEYGTIQGL